MKAPPSRALRGACWLAALALGPAQVAQGDDEVQRLRLTETSITETGIVSGAGNEALTTKGYGFGYISTYGVGGAYTCLNTFNRSGSADISLRHCYFDLTYTGTLGSYVLLTAGGGYGVKGSASVTMGGVVASGRDFRGVALFAGPGLSLGSFEIYWIYRRNWASYQIADHRDSLASRHYQLGLGWHF